MSESGWAFRVLGLKADSSTIEAGGAWTAGFAYADLFDAAVHVGAAIQGDNSDVAARRFDVDRISVLAGICPASLEPSLP